MSDGFESDSPGHMPSALRAAGLALALILVAFQIYTAGFGRFPPLSQRAFHVTLLMIFLALYGMQGEGKGNGFLWMSWLGKSAAALFALIAGGYIILEEARLTQSFFVVAEMHEIVFAAGLTILILNAARYTTGWALPLLAGGMIVYALFGNLIPGHWGHPGFTLTYLVEYLYLGVVGMWGTVTGLSASLIAIFIIFGGFLLATGATRSFMDVALLIAGRFPGGAAKVACVSSALFGMVSGSAVANVATTGNFTIPSMKRLGYRPGFAGAVEATASSGGQITPPIMGAGAFVMAELLGVPYIEIVYAAIIPAFVFYACVWMSIDVEARREGMRGFSDSEIPRAREALAPSRIGPLAATLAITIGAMLSGFTPGYAAFLGICTNVGLYLLLGGGAEREPFVGRLRALLHGVEMSAHGIARIMPLLVAAQIVLALVGLTGVGIKLSDAILTVGEGGGLLVGTVLAMVVALILGMGMPTTAAYLIAAAVAAPALIALGLEPMVAHFFVFYSALLSALTPPVCTAVFTAAVIAQTHWWPVCVNSMRLAGMKYLLPFFFVFRPGVLLKGEWPEIAWTTFMALLASWLIAVGLGRYFRRRIPLPAALVLTLAGVAVASGSWLADALALVLVAVTVAIQLLRKGTAVNDADGRKPDHHFGGI